MKNFVKLFVAVIAISCLAGCGFNLYPCANQNVSKTEVILQNKNFRVLGEASGTASATYILGIGGLSQKAIRENAVADMYKKARLAGSQTIVNINVHQHVGGVAPFYYQVQYTATGQIIEFTE